MMPRLKLEVMLENVDRVLRVSDEEIRRHPGLMRQVKAQREAAKQRQASPGKAAHARPQFGRPASAVNRQFALTPTPALKPIAGGRP
jgi:hypothetical protein